jgi:HTH-type transcriptional regulator/antitoxin HigA
MSDPLRPATMPPPGAMLKRELEARGWTQKDLAAIIQRPEQAISEIANGEKRITPETAISFASAFGTSAEFWLNLQSNHDLWQAQRAQAANAADPIRRKARIYERAPIAELVRRGWIKKSESLEGLEREVLKFLGISSLDEPSRIAASFRQSEAFTPEAAAQNAWLRRVDLVSGGKRCVGPFRAAAFKAELDELIAFSSRVDSAPKALAWLGKRGVAVTIVKHLPKTFTDGAAYIRDDGTPVIALSLRYDRIDSFWFTLLHELGHIVLGHPGGHVDANLSVGEGQSPHEREANEFAQEHLIPGRRFQSWLKAHRQISKADIASFAQELGRHPGIVVGQLQHRRVLPYSRCRELLVPVGPVLGPWVSR